MPGVGMVPMVTGLPALGCVKWWYSLVWFGLNLSFGVVLIEALWILRQQVWRRFICTAGVAGNCLSTLGSLALILVLASLSFSFLGSSASSASVTYICSEGARVPVVIGPPVLCFSKWRYHYACGAVCGLGLGVVLALVIGFFQLELQHGFLGCLGLIGQLEGIHLVCVGGVFGVGLITYISSLHREIRHPAGKVVRRLLRVYTFIA